MQALPQKKTYQVSKEGAQAWLIETQAEFKSWLRHLLTWNENFLSFFTGCLKIDIPKFSLLPVPQVKRSETITRMNNLLDSIESLQKKKDGCYEINFAAKEKPELREVFTRLPEALHKLYPNVEEPKTFVDESSGILKILIPEAMYHAPMPMSSTSSASSASSSSSTRAVPPSAMQGGSSSVSPSIFNNTPALPRSVMPPPPPVQSGSLLAPSSSTTSAPIRNGQPPVITFSVPPASSSTSTAISTPVQQASSQPPARTMQPTLSAPPVPSPVLEPYPVTPEGAKAWLQDFFKPNEDERNKKFLLIFDRACNSNSDPRDPSTYRAALSKSLVFCWENNEGNYEINFVSEKTTNEPTAVLALLTALAGSYPRITYSGDAANLNIVVPKDMYRHPVAMPTPPTSSAPASSSSTSAQTFDPTLWAQSSGRSAPSTSSSSSSTAQHRPTYPSK
ncbi:MAG: hypothetical protein WCW01_06490 [Gammaproteobacteria bacterium]